MKNIENVLVPWSGRGTLYTKKEVQAVVNAMNKADPLTQGKYQDLFEKKFSEFVGVKHAFAVSSCTAALELAAVLLRLGKGDEVIIPGHTFAASAIPFGRTRARLVWADIDPATRLITAETIKKCLTTRTKAVVVVHLYGLLADMDPIMKLARKNRIAVIEDAAQALGAGYKGRQAGSMGDYGCYSFHSHKNISTLGEGGMLAVKDPAVAKMVPGLRHNGMRDFTCKRDKYWVPAMGNVDFDLPGIWPYNFCLGEIQCALGVEMLAGLKARNDKRRQRALRIFGALRDYPELQFQSVPEDCGHSFHLLTAKYSGAGTRDEFIELMAFKHGVKVVVQYNPLYRYPMFIKAGFGKADCPNTDEYYDKMVSFPFQDWLTDKQVSNMVKAIKSTIRELRERAR